MIWTTVSDSSFLVHRQTPRRCLLGRTKECSVAPGDVFGVCVYVGGEESRGELLVRTQHDGVQGRL